MSILMNSLRLWRIILTMLENVDCIQMYVGGRRNMIDEIIGMLEENSDLEQAEKID